MNVYVLQSALQMARRGVEVEIFTRATSSADQPVVKVAPGVFRDFPPDKVKFSDGAEDKYKFIRHVERQEKISIKPPYVRS